MPDLELCLLVEGNPPARLRPVQVSRQTNLLIERPRTLEGLHLPERVWRFQGERADKGQRVFRETLPVVAEPPERPLYDELQVKL